ncbi:conserved hypothetical protein [Vibrio phage 496E54-1]|nr:conserved hypothetical protein [Vibrio phage 495E54-1]CAH9014036.1 conserved hypothetical protein [Vibrio phage 496E54-1]
MKEYELFNGRYTVEVGKLGGVKVHSNLLHYPKTMRMYGKDKEGLRFVNLTKDKGGIAESYCVDQIKKHVIGGDTLQALTQAEIMKILNNSKPFPLLDNDKDITSLPAEYNHNDQVVYVEELEGEKKGKTITRHYTRNNWKHKSNGFLQYNYLVTTNTSGIVTNSNTKSFTDEKKVFINNLSEVEDHTLEEVITLLSEEKSKRGSDKKFMEKLNYQVAMEDLIG